MLFKKKDLNKKNKSDKDNILMKKNDLNDSEGQGNAIAERIMTLQKSHQFEVDQFRALRSKLFLSDSSSKKTRSIVVTSPGIGEGKTFVASNLAISISQNIDMKRTLLLDCDLRLPSVHRFFGYEDVAGLSEYLSGEKKSIAPLLLKPIPDKLAILPGGRVPYNPSELLSSMKMKSLLEEIQVRYEDRYLFADLPSPRIVAESDIILSMFDGVIIVVQYGRTPASNLFELIDILGKEKIIGIVYNRFDTSMNSSLYRMYSKYIKRIPIY